MFCVHAPGVDPGTNVLVATIDNSSANELTPRVLLAVGGGGSPTPGRFCGSDEFEVTVYTTDTSTGVNNVSFAFVIG